MKLINLNQTVYSDTKSIEIAKKKIALKNGKVLDVNITVQLEYDECYQLEDMDDLCYSETEYKELERKLESSQISPHVIVVTASYKNHSERACLGGVLFEKFETVKEIDDNYDLVSMSDEALEDLKNSLNDILEDLTTNEKDRELLLKKIAHHNELAELFERDIDDNEPQFNLEVTLSLLKKYKTGNWIEAYKKCHEFHSEMLKKYLTEYEEQSHWDLINQLGLKYNDDLIGQDLT